MKYIDNPHKICSKQAFHMNGSFGFVKDRLYIKYLVIDLINLIGKTDDILENFQ